MVQREALGGPPPKMPPLVSLWPNAGQPSVQVNYDLIPIGGEQQKETGVVFAPPAGQRTAYPVAMLWAAGDDTINLGGWMLTGCIGFSADPGTPADRLINFVFTQTDPVTGITLFSYVVLPSGMWRIGLGMDGGSAFGVSRAVLALSVGAPFVLP
jgi:hypothetical protein